MITCIGVGYVHFSNKKFNEKMLAEQKGTENTLEGKMNSMFGGTKFLAQSLAHSSRNDTILIIAQLVDVVFTGIIGILTFLAFSLILPMPVGGQYFLLTLSSLQGLGILAVSAISIYSQCKKNKSDQSSVST